MDDWGCLDVIRVSYNSHFWNIIDELIDDNSGFVANRDMILDAYTGGNMFGISVRETPSMRIRNARNDNIFCKGGRYILPCFCIRDCDRAIIIWTHSRARRRGFAKRMVNVLGIKSAYRPIITSIGFWKKCNIIYSA